MKIVLIGAGNLATNLGKALYRAGHEIIQVYSRTAESADDLADLFECPSTIFISDIKKDADIYIVSIKDDALEALASHFVKGRENALFVHTAGSVALDVFPSMRRGVIYPMQTFSKRREVDFRSVPVFIEAADDADLQILRSLMESISDNVCVMESARRKYLHLAAVFCCNFVNHCFVQTEKILKEQDIPFETMLPLIDETVAKVHSMQPSQAQTGPAVRWDEQVMDCHKSLLDDKTAELYDLISKSIHYNS